MKINVFVSMYVPICIEEMISCKDILTCTKVWTCLKVYRCSYTSGYPPENFPFA